MDKNGGDVRGGGGFGATTAASHGSKLVFISETEFADATHGGSPEATEYVATRTLGGWLTMSAIPRPEPVAGDVRLILSAADLSVSLLETSALLPSIPPSTVDADVNIYQRDNETGGVSPFTEVASFYAPVASPNLAHVMFATETVLTDDADVPVSGAKVYERTGGQIRLVSVQPDGTPFQSAALPAGAAAFTFEPFSTVGGVSEDGQHLFFRAEGEIYRRTGGIATALATPTELEPADPSGPLEKTYRQASRDGDRVLFTSSEQLTDDANTGASRAGSDLYLYDFDSDDVINLAATDGGDGARVVGVMGASSSLDSVYYVAQGVVVDPPGALDPVDGGINLYRWDEDGTPGGSNRFIATLSADDSDNWHRLTGRWTARPSADGRYLAFESVAAIPGFAGGGVKQVYRYDADGNGGAGDLTCVSCNPNGDPPIGGSSITVHSANLSVQRWELPRALSNDGSRVFFNSEDDLLPRDSNGETDAYMWQGGEVSLLSSGTSSTDSYFFNASDTGDDAFILTADQLVPKDNDDLVDLYDARVNGGFPAPAPRADCTDDGCQGAGSTGPAPSGVGTTALDGGDAESSPRLTLRLSRLSDVQRRRLAAGRRIGVRVRVTRAAQVRATVVGRIGGHRLVLARGVRRASRAGAVVVRVRLSARARRALDRAGSMRVLLTVKAPGARPQTDGFRLRKPR